MKDKEWNKHRKKIDKLFDKWINVLGLRWYAIKLVWKAGDGERGANSFRTTMRVRSRWEYRIATITIWLEELIEMSNEEIEKAIVHELCHIFVQPLRHEDFDIEKEEYVVESLATAFMWVREEKK